MATLEDLNKAAEEYARTGAAVDAARVAAEAAHATLTAAAKRHSAAEAHYGSVTRSYATSNFGQPKP